jgi:hypothetical protein
MVRAPVNRPSARTLTAEQEMALEALRAAAAAKKFAVFLLQGVTGSGKTEVYLRLTETMLQQGQSVLILVPEIALTPAVASAFREAFGDLVAVQHSGLSDGERYDQWHRIRRGEVSIVIGTRSAVFAPLASLGLIIVDEEHDTSFKQEETPRYHGRDVAVVRAKQENALVVLGSATPSLESAQNAANGRYTRLLMQRRVEDRPHASRVRGRWPGCHSQPAVDIGDCLPACGNAAIVDLAESPRPGDRRVLPPVRRHAGLPELQRLADRPHGREGPSSRPLPLLQLFVVGAEGVSGLCRPVSRTSRVWHRARRR